MYVIALEGPHDAGKTHTLNIVYQFLLQNNYVQVPGCFQDLGNDDCLDVLTNGVQKVGIVTQGDYAINQLSKGQISVSTHLATLDGLGCHKAVCASTTGPHKSRIQQAIAAYPQLRQPVVKLPQPIVSMHRIDNYRDATTIMSFI